MASNMLGTMFSDRTLFISETNIFGSRYSSTEHWTHRIVNSFLFSFVSPSDIVHMVKRSKWLQIDLCAPQFDNSYIKHLLNNSRLRRMMYTRPLNGFSSNWRENGANLMLCILHWFSVNLLLNWHTVQCVHE